MTTLNPAFPQTIYIRLSKRGVIYGRGCYRINSLRVDYNCEIDERGSITLRDSGWTSFRVKFVAEDKMAGLISAIEEVVGAKNYTLVDPLEAPTRPTAVAGTTASTSNAMFVEELERMLDGHEEVKGKSRKKDGGGRGKNNQPNSGRRNRGGGKKDAKASVAEVDEDWLKDGADAVAPKEVVVEDEEKVKLRLENLQLKTEVQDLKEELRVQEKDIKKLKDCLSIFMR